MYSNLDEFNARQTIRKVAKNARDLLLIELFYSAGMRVCDVVSMNIGDIILEGNSRTDAVVNGRIVFFCHNVRSAAMYYLNTLSDVDPHLPLFVGRNGRVTANVISQTLGRLQRRAKQFGGTRRAKRSLGNYLFGVGADLKILQNILGHKSHKTTKALIGGLNRNSDPQTRAKHMVSQFLV